MTTNPQVLIVASTIALAEYKSFGVYMCQEYRTFQPCSHLLEIIAKASTPEDLANRVQYLPL